MHTIEVDDEVYAFLQSRAIPFVDTTPGKVLKRLLPILSRLPSTEVAENALPGTTLERPLGTSQKTIDDAKLPDIPTSVPDGLGQVLEVIHLVKSQHVNRETATHEVAERHHVKYATVADKYGRQIGKSTYEIDEMLDEPGLLELRRVLKSRFGNYTAFIDKFISNLILRAP